MGKSSGSAPQPDKNIGKAALKQAETGEAWLTFAKEAFEVSNERQIELDTLTKRVTEMQLGVAEEQAGWSREDRERYQEKFKPIEDEFLEEARNYASPERQEAAAAEARADVQSAAASERDIARRQAMSYGINPASGRFQGIERSGELGTALASATAQNRARQGVRDRGLALKADAANLGRGLPAQSAQAAALGLGAGNAAVGNNAAANSQYLQSTGIMGQGFGGAMSGYAGQANTLSNLYGQQLSAWSADRAARAGEIGGIFGGLGTAAGLIMSSDKKKKKDKKPVKKGSALKAVKDMPVEAWTYKEGVGDEGRHVGTYAQDFAEATGIGDGKVIAMQDAIGITMKAVQDLDDKVESLVTGLGIQEAA